MKDLLDDEGNWLTSEAVIHRLSRTNNWIIEFSTLKKTDVKMCKYMQRSLLLNANFYYKNKMIQPFEMTSRDLYLILSSKKK